MLEIACATQGMQNAASQMHNSTEHADECQHAACTILDASQNAITIADACQYAAYTFSDPCQHVACTISDTC
jgi:hypothetical protein